MAGEVLAQPVEPIGPVRLERAFPGLSFEQPLYLTHAGDGTDRIFVLKRRGVVEVFRNGPSPADSTFLDIRDRVSRGGTEEGLLGLAFDPSFASNGHFYVYYSASRPRRSVVSRFGVSADPNVADLNSELVILEVPQPFANHNGGMIEFGPDGYLYLGLGDGGSRGDPSGNGQDRSTLLGSILRLDVGNASADAPYTIPADNPFIGAAPARGEVWAYGLRNPWRFSFDSETGDLWAADVGQDAFEEVDVVLGGGNYGWNVMEGAHCFRAASCDRAGLELPVVEYDHSLGCSITGGYVYRGADVPALSGAYVYADFCSGRIWALRYDGERVTHHAQLLDVPFRVSSFGVDERGELYALGFDGGIYRIVEAVEAPAPASIRTPALATATPQPAFVPTPPRSTAAWGAVVAAVVVVAGGVLFWLVRRRGDEAPS